MSIKNDAHWSSFHTKKGANGTGAFCTEKIRRTNGLGIWKVTKSQK